MAQNFYTKWQDAILADAGGYVSKEYRRFQTALVRKIGKSTQSSPLNSQ